jgi:NCS1 family nucleobase:cation symporter-1
MKNVMPASTSMTSADFLCFWLFLIVSVPLLCVPPENFRKPFLATAVISTTCCFAPFIWSLARAHGAGPLVKGEESTIAGVTPVKGSALAWAFFYGISSQMGQI